jgi:hypothetical protein
MTRPAIIAGILAVIGTLALAAFLSRRSPPPTAVQAAASFEIVRIVDRFAERTAPKEEPEAESPVIEFPDSHDSG